MAKQPIPKPNPKEPKLAELDPYIYDQLYDTGQRRPKRQRGNRWAPNGNRGSAIPPEGYIAVYKLVEIRKVVPQHTTIAQAP